MSARRWFWVVFGCTEGLIVLLTALMDFEIAKLIALLALTALIFWIVHLSVFHARPSSQAENRDVGEAVQTDSPLSLIMLALGAVGLFSLSVLQGMKLYALSVSVFLLALWILIFRKHVRALAVRSSARTTNSVMTTIRPTAILWRNMFCFAIPVVLDFTYNILAIPTMVFVAILVVYLVLVYGTMAMALKSSGNLASRQARVR